METGSNLRQVGTARETLDPTYWTRSLAHAPAPEAPLFEGHSSPRFWSNSALWVPLEALHPVHVVVKEAVASGSAKTSEQLCGMWPRVEVHSRPPFNIENGFVEGTPPELFLGVPRRQSSTFLLLERLWPGHPTGKQKQWRGQSNVTLQRLLIGKFGRGQKCNLAVPRQWERQVARSPRGFQLVFGPLAIHLCVCGGRWKLAAPARMH